MDDQAQILQVETAGGNIGGDTDAGTAVAQRLEGVGPLFLAEFTRQGDDREAAIAHAAHQLVDGGAGRAEDQRAFAVGMAHDIDDGVLFVAGGDEQRLVFDVDVLGLLGLGHDADSIALVAAGEGGDALGHRGGEEQGAARFRRALENELQFVAEAHVEHFVGFVEHDGAHIRRDERSALDMVRQAARRADDDMGAAGERLALLAHVHAADTGGQAGACGGVKPLQFAGDLLGQFPGWGNDQGERRVGIGELGLGAEQVGGHGEAEGDGLAGACLGGHEQVLARQFRCNHCRLHLREGLIAACGERLGKGRRNEGHISHLAFVFQGRARRIHAQRAVLKRAGARFGCSLHVSGRNTTAANIRLRRD